MEIVTTYALLEDGQEICYADPGLPSDFSRSYIGPERGAFKAVSLSASASTMFVINEAGEMWTYLKRDYLPGRTGSPKLFLVTLEIPDNAFDGLSEAFAGQLAQKYAQHDKRLFQYTMAASNRFIFLHTITNWQGNFRKRHKTPLPSGRKSCPVR
jgi:hypothetical protein